MMKSGHTIDGTGKAMRMRVDQRSARYRWKMARKSMSNNELPPFESLGFKSGLEIHHQLATKHKLFCRCPAGLVHREPDARIIRHMRPTLSELGEYDRTALMEFKTRKNVVYELYRDNVCTYEMDDTPPFPINQEALDITIEIAMLLNCSIVDEIHVSRKQYLDGSIPTGFQRTAVVGVNGWVPYQDRKIAITHVTVEEDACREISDVGHQIVFRTDRLSTPLIEVITGAEMRTPQEVAEVDALLGRIIRSTGRVRRGMGSVRQDVNVSIEGSVRVEIKGVPRTGLIPELTRLEAWRQRALLDILRELQIRGVTKKNFEFEKKNVTELLYQTASPHLHRALAEGGEAGAIVLRGFGGGLLNRPILPGKTFADEFVGRVRVIACLDRLPNLFHSDNPPADGPSAEEWKAITASLGVRRLDVAVLTWGSAQDVKTALEEIRLRAIDATRGVCHETRQVQRRGNTTFERLLPGPNRMYPDTDSPPIQITAERLAAIRARMPERVYEKEAHYRALGLTPALAAAIVNHPRNALFERLVRETKVPPAYICAVLTQMLKALRRAGFDPAKLPDDRLAAVFAALAAESFTREALADVLIHLIDHTEAAVADAVLALGLTPVKSERIDEIISQAMQNLPERLCRREDAEAAHRYIMGVVMRTMRGRFPGRKAAEMVAEALKRP